MKVVLLNDVRKVGRKFDIVAVSDGYALNMLIPQKHAIPATPENIKKAEKLRETIKNDKVIMTDLLEKNMDSLKDAKIVIKAKANEKGHLFAGILVEDIVKAIEEQTKQSVLPDFVDLKEHIKEIGDHEVMIRAGKAQAKITVTVEGE